MSIDDIAAHYTSGGLWERLITALREDGVDPDHPSLADLAPYDHFHGRALEATEDLAKGRDLGPDHHVLDIGSGIGGPARFMAERFGCRITGIDLTAEFCAVAQRLNGLLGMADRVSIEHGSATAMPFAAESFDGAYSMNVSMNIQDKPGLYREIHRVLRPGGWLTLSEIAAGERPELLRYPTPWASSAQWSFLATPERTRESLEAAGFEVESLTDSRAAAARFGARSREAVEAGGKPLQRAVHIIHADISAEAAKNTADGGQAGYIIPIEVRCTRR